MVINLFKLKNYQIYYKLINQNYLMNNQFKEEKNYNLNNNL